MAKDELTPRERRLRYYKRWAFWLIVGGFASTVLYGVASSPDNALDAAMALLFTAAAPFALGALTGFLFGIPKTLQGDSPAITVQQPTTPPTPPTPGALATTTPLPGGPNSQRQVVVTHQVNTNLEQISDWLTKILVGVGLTQLTQLPEAIQSVSEFLSSTMGTCDDGYASPAVIGAILIYFSVAGFLTGYLVTRLVLGPEIKQVEAPDPGAVDRLASPALSPSVGRDDLPISAQDAAAVLQFSLDEMKTTDELIAWGRAQLKREPNSAVQAMERAVQREPGDRRAIENLIFAALYADPPQGFERAIRYAGNFLGRPDRKESPRDAGVYAYLACAYGQQYRYERDKKKAAPGQLAAIREQVIANVRKALDLDPSWKTLFRQVMDPRPGSAEDDLEALRDDPELKALVS